MTLPVSAVGRTIGMQQVLVMSLPFGGHGLTAPIALERSAMAWATMDSPASDSATDRPS